MKSHDKSIKNLEKYNINTRKAILLHLVKITLLVRKEYIVVRPKPPRDSEVSLDMTNSLDSEIDWLLDDTNIDIGNFILVKFATKRTTHHSRYY